MPPRLDPADGHEARREVVARVRIVAAQDLRKVLELTQAVNPAREDLPTRARGQLRDGGRAEAQGAEQLRGAGRIPTAVCNFEAKSTHIIETMAEQRSCR